MFVGIITVQMHRRIVHYLAYILIFVRIDAGFCTKFSACSTLDVEIYDITKEGV